MEDKKEKPVLGIYVRVEDAGSSIIDNARMAWVVAMVVDVTDRHEGKFQFAGEHGKAAKFTHIMLKDLLSTDRPNPQYSRGDLKAYGLDGKYAIELDSVSATLKKIGKVMGNLNAKHGSPVNFAQHVLRFANAVGTDIIVTDKSEKGFDRSGYRYNFSDLEAGQWHITHALEAWFERWTPKSPMGETADAVVERIAFNG